jgi:hypothetical protein
MGRIKRVFVGANPWLSNPNVVSFERPLQIGLSSGAPSLHQYRRRSRGEVLDRFSDFLECTSLDLSDAFTRYVKCFRKRFERQWFVYQMSGLEDSTLSVVQDVDRGDKCVVLVLYVVLCDDDGFR